MPKTLSPSPLALTRAKRAGASYAVAASFTQASRLAARTSPQQGGKEAARQNEGSNPAGLSTADSIKTVGRGLLGGLVGVLVDALRPTSSQRARCSHMASGRPGGPALASSSGKTSQPGASAPRHPPVLPRWPWRVDTPAQRPTPSTGQAPSAQGRQHTALRVTRVAEAGLRRASAGRMVISGRMADVCAELDRLCAADLRH